MYPLDSEMGYADIWSHCLYSILSVSLEINIGIDKLSRVDFPPRMSLIRSLKSRKEPDVQMQ